MPVNDPASRRIRELELQNQELRHENRRLEARIRDLTGKAACTCTRQLYQEHANDCPARSVPT